MKYIDIHGHINFPDYDKERSVGIGDRKEVIKRAQYAGVGIIIVGTDFESSKAVVEFAEKHENMWAIIGVHPTHVGEVNFGGTNTGKTDLSSSTGHEAWRELAINHKVVAIGECGLDYFHPGPVNMTVEEYKESQRKVFIQHIELANEVGKPLMLHVRNGKSEARNSFVIGVGVDGVNAYQEAVSLLKEYAKVPANFHFFAGTEQDLKEIIKIGALVSFTGVITFTRDYDELIRQVPIDRIMSETDCPFVAPVPYRGKRNEPTYVIEVVKKIAEIRGESEEKISAQLLENTKKFFKIS